MAEKRHGLSLGTRLFLSTALILLVALGAAIAVTTVLGQKIAVSAARDRITGSSSVQADFQRQRFQQLELITEILAGDPEFKAYLANALANADRLSVLDQLEERGGDLGYDVAMFVRPDGRLFVRTDQPELLGADLSGNPLVRAVQREYHASGIWQEGKALLEAVAVPMALGENLLGYLAVGYRIGDVRALEVKKGTGSDVVFLTGTPSGAEPVASTLTPQQLDRLLSALRLRGDLLSRVTQQGEAVSDARLELDGGRWLALLSPLADAEGAPVGALVSLASLDRELAGYEGIRNLLIAAGVVALGAALALSYLLSRRAMRPIHALVRATGAARQGDYDVTIPPGGSGEVVELADSFNRLLADLREKRDMADYVQKLSRSLPEPAAASPSRALDATRPAVGKMALLGIELRRYVASSRGGQPGATFDRLSRDVRRIAAAVTGHDGKVESVIGQRVLASFAGPLHSDRALAAAAEAVAAVGERENAFDEAEAPAVALVAGDVLAGTVAWGVGADRALLGLPMQQLDGLLREAAPGEILLSRGLHDEVATTLESAGIRLSPQRGLLSSQAIYLLPAEEMARAAGSGTLAGVTGPTGTPAGGVRNTLSGVAPGSLLGSRFEILSVLGAGGMGMVYKARDRELDDLVALKMIRPEVAGDRELVDRLKSELKLARKITHPNVLRTFDFGEVEGIPFISMEYVRGLTLRAMLERSGRLPYTAGLRLARQILSGLAAAHELGILHRDIKPENVILDATGNSKLMDFGLARPVERSEPGQTRAGFVVGTPHYLAPEQLQGQESDRRADVYACGVVLYEIFTGCLPFGGGNPMEILLQHLKEPPTPPRQHWPEMPAALEAVLLRCLEKDPAGRFAGAEELLRAVEAIPA